MKTVKGYFAALVDRQLMGHAIKVALVVGTILMVINHGSAIRSGSMTRQRWQSALLTYLVPYAVNIHGQYTARSKGIKQSRREVVAKKL
jgi:hypothetical protein